MLAVGLGTTDGRGLLDQRAQLALIDILEPLDPHAALPDVSLRQGIAIRLGEVSPILGTQHVQRDVIFLGREAEDVCVTLTARRVAVVERAVPDHLSRDCGLEFRRSIANQIVYTPDLRAPRFGELLDELFRSHPYIIRLSTNLIASRFR